MHGKLNRLTKGYLVVLWSFLLTIGVAGGFWGLQQNREQDQQDTKNADYTISVSNCHGLADTNQAVRDVLSILSIETKVTADMTESQKETIRVANDRRQNGYKVLSSRLFPTPKCQDGYQAKSIVDELLPLLTEPPKPLPTTTISTR